MRYEKVTLKQGACLCGSLLNQAFDEAGTPNHAFCLDESIYDALDASKSFGIVAFDGETIAGFCSVFVYPAAHYASLVAANDVIYVQPSYRNSLLAGRLMAMAEREAKLRGAALFQWAAGENTPLDLALSKRSSYRLLQKVFFKEL